MKLIYYHFFFLFISLASCSVRLTKGEKVNRINYYDLPADVKTSYSNSYSSEKDLPATINLDSIETDFYYLKNTSVEIIKAGKEVFKIGERKFYIPWNFNRETNPYILYKKKFYCIVGDSDSWNNYSQEQLQKNQFLEIDLMKYLKY